MKCHIYGIEMKFIHSGMEFHNYPYLDIIHLVNLNLYNR